MDSLINTPAWRSVVRRLLKSEMQAHDLKYADLSQRLAERFGTVQTDANLRQKISKGTLGTQLFLQLLVVMEVDRIDLERVMTMYAKVRDSTP